MTISIKQIKSVAVADFVTLRLSTGRITILRSWGNA